MRLAKLFLLGLFCFKAFLSGLKLFLFAFSVSHQMPGICICTLTASTPHAATKNSVRCMYATRKLGPKLGRGGFLSSHPPT